MCRFNLCQRIWWKLRNQNEDRLETKTSTYNLLDERCVSTTTTMTSISLTSFMCYHHHTFVDSSHMQFSLLGATDSVNNDQHWVTNNGDNKWNGEIEINSKCRLIHLFVFFGHNMGYGTSMYSIMLSAVVNRMGTKQAKYSIENESKENNWKVLWIALICFFFFSSSNFSIHFFAHM